MNLNFLVTSLTLALTDAYYLRGNKEEDTFQSSEPLPPHQCLFFTDYCDLNPHEHGIQTIAHCDNGNTRVDYLSLTNQMVSETLTFEGKEEMNPCTDPSKYFLYGRLWFSGEDPRGEQIVEFKPENP